MSLVNGLYLADSLAQLMKTEFNALSGGTCATAGTPPAATVRLRSMAGGCTAITGHRRHGIVLSALLHDKLMQDFFQAGDTVLTAASDYTLLSAYAVRRQDGTLTILAINKDPANTYTGQVAVAGYTPASNGTVYSYGIPQDNAAETNGPSSQDVARWVSPASEPISATPSRPTPPTCSRSHRGRRPCWPFRQRRPRASSSFNSKASPARRIFWKARRICRTGRLSRPTHSSETR